MDGTSSIILVLTGDSPFLWLYSTSITIFGGLGLSSPNSWQNLLFHGQTPFSPSQKIFFVHVWMQGIMMYYNRYVRICI